MKLELLSPAKDLNCAIAAINCGADAVYIGADAFGARLGARNSIDDIKKVVDFAHIFNVKVYVALNTILNDDELDFCIDLIKKLYEIKVDALIIQDFAILYLSLFQKIPPILLHISTQCDNRGIEKIKFFENLGIKRVILPRETSLNEIQKIRKNTSLELEHFVSGALCVSYSGQCYMSAYFGANSRRSANKGACAQACRKKYSLVDKNGKILAKNKYLLSLKDNNLSNHLEKLADSGVMSFKIEGRLKDENYVKNQTLYFNNLLEKLAPKYQRTGFGKIIKDFTPDISKTFNRGFCDDYLFNKKDNIYNFATPKSLGEEIGVIQAISENNFTIKIKNKNLILNPQDGLVFGELSSGCLINKAEKTKDGFKIFPNKNENLNKIFKKGDKVFRNLDFEFNKILTSTKTSRKLEVEVIIEKDEIIIYDINKNKVSISILEFEIAQNQEKMKQNYQKSFSKMQNTPFIVENIIFKIEELKFIPLSILNDLRRKLSEKLVEKILSRYKTKTQKPLDIAQFSENSMDYKSNVYNKKAKEFYELCNCKITQDCFEKMIDSAEKTALKNKELMRTKHCLKKIFLGCDKKIEDDFLYLIDEASKIKYKLLFDCKNCEMIIKSI